MCDVQKDMKHMVPDGQVGMSSLIQVIGWRPSSEGTFSDAE